jgi:Mg2+ and Co2+ transporter CorA
MSTKKLTDNKKSKEEPSKNTSKTEKKSATGKKKLVVSYKNLPSDLISLVKEKYPKGYSDYLIKVNKNNGDFFYAITLDTETVDYLIKVDVKIDSEIEEVEKALFEQPDNVDDEFPDNDTEPFASDGDEE